MTRVKRYFREKVSTIRGGCKCAAADNSDKSSCENNVFSNDIFELIKWARIGSSYREEKVDQNLGLHRQLVKVSPFLDQSSVDGSFLLLSLSGDSFHPPLQWLLFRNEQSWKKILDCLKIQHAALPLLTNSQQIQIKKKRLRRYWVKPLLKPAVRDSVGGSARIISYLKDSDHEGFYKLFHMGPGNFEHIHDLVKPLIQKQVIRRQPISTEIRLAATLLYLAKGSNITLTPTFFSIGVSKLYGIIAETCQALKVALSPLYLKFATEPAHWLSIAHIFWLEWRNPNCAGALDGTHICILRPPQGGTLFFNYKYYHSIISLIICDADVRVIWFSLGDYGMHYSPCKISIVSKKER
ncbi:hypothetical protein QAD02_014053 [Eretmocerus hayati]|uniref:Uncharacterized protein n=1 Tax=Eretmocerus hayati TaxID=131215 RepID=A0ACC2P5Z2_9HYME|nr:hypothetical protein QAD02_014053 [Eretmocerus hayati]